METTGRTRTTERMVETTAAPWCSAFGFWFTFTYLPPASLVGLEERMR